MSTDIERLELRMEANMTQINRAISKLNRDTAASSRDLARRYSEAGRRVEQTFQRMQRAATAALGAIGVGLSTRALTGLITDSLQAAENLADLSNQINANVEGLQTLRFAVDQNGGSADLLDRGLRRLAEGMGRVLAGETNEATRAMERLGLAQRIQSGEIQTTDQLFRVLADALQGVTTQQERAALASQIFGQRLGVQLSQSLSLGSDGLQQFEERLRAAGGVLGEDVVAQGAAANAKLRELHQILATQLQGAVLQNAGELEVMATQLAAIAAGALNATSQIARLIQRLDELGQRSFAGSNLGRYLDTPAGRGLINAIGNNPSLNPIGALGLGLESLENASTGGPQARNPERRTSGIPFAPEFDGFGPPPPPSPGSPSAASAPIRPVPAFPPEAPYDPFDWVENARLAQEALDGTAEKLGLMEKGLSGANRELDGAVINIDEFRDTFRSAFRAGFREAILEGDFEAGARAFAAHAVNSMINRLADWLADAAFDLIFDVASQAILGAKIRSAHQLGGQAAGLHVHTSMVRGAAQAGDIMARSIVQAGNQAAMRMRAASGGGGGGSTEGGIGAILGAAVGAMFGNPMMGAQIGGSIGSAFGGGKAAGGPVRPGMAYRVGERGAETFVPSVPGMVVPNTAQAMAGRSAQQEVTVKIKLDEGPMFASRVETISADVAGRMVPVSVDLARQAVRGDLVTRQRGRLT